MFFASADVRDDVASLRIHNSNMALTVNVACADQSFATMVTDEFS